MKHKQIRNGVFESNSSSTHAFSIMVSTTALPQFIPIIRGPILVPVDAREDETWENKLTLLCGYLWLDKRHEDIVKIVNTLTEFCGSPIELDFSELQKYQEGKWPHESAVDYLSTFQGGEDADDEETLKGKIEKIISSETALLAFVCRSNTYDLWCGYDG